MLLRPRISFVIVLFKFYIFLSLHYFKIQYLYIIPNKRNMNLRTRNMNLRSIPPFFNIQCMSYIKLPKRYIITIFS